VLEARRERKTAKVYVVGPKPAARRVEPPAPPDNVELDAAATLARLGL
jgi:hypothetical protein